MVTIGLASGRSEEWIRRRTGHTSSALERYRRVAGTLRELDLGDWVPLDAAIPELAAANAAANTAAERQVPTVGRPKPQRYQPVGARGFERTPRKRGVSRTIFRNLGGCWGPA
jgi:hypothetical protein